MSFGARALIRLGALEHNLNTIRRSAPEAKVMAVIKANAYGHGMEIVAQRLADVDAFAVARLPEALRLRGVGVSQPIVLLAGVADREQLDQAVEADLEMVVHCPEQIALLAAHDGRAINAWLKIDTGMNRLGFRPAEAADLIKTLSETPAVAELRLMTHLASADRPEDAATRRQIDCFRDLARDFRGAVSIANSPATLGWSEVAAAKESFGFPGDHWIRPGIALFGISPFADRSGTDLGLQPVMQFESRLIARKAMQAGARVGYRGRYVSDTDTQLGIIAAGYGDGYSRHFRDGTPVLLNGRRVSLIGNVSMDLIAVDLGPNAMDAVGDVATLWGAGLPVEEVAPWADAIPYELVCGVMNREESEVVA